MRVYDPRQPQTGAHIIVDGEHTFYWNTGEAIKVSISMEAFRRDYVLAVCTQDCPYRVKLGIDNTPRDTAY